MNTEHVNDQIQAKILQILKKMQSGLPAQFLQQIMAGLTDKQRNNLQKAVNGVQQI